MGITQNCYFSLPTDIDSIKSQYSSSVLDRMAFKPKKSLEEVIPNAPPDGIDLLKKLLQFNPDKRLTAEQALKHPFVARFHNPDEEPSMDYDVIPALDDDVQLSVDEYRVKLYEVGTVKARQGKILRSSYSSIAHKFVD